ncbi:hypothetical protein [uncultured Veillonella sp.]|nr:hypothetical protein [uncultured Veillonella sp.]
MNKKYEVLFNPYKLNKGTRQGIDFYPKSKQFALRFKSEEY